MAVVPTILLGQQQPKGSGLTSRQELQAGRQQQPLGSGWASRQELQAGRQQQPLGSGWASRQTSLSHNHQRHCLLRSSLL